MPTHVASLTTDATDALDVLNAALAARGRTPVPRGPATIGLGLPGGPAISAAGANELGRLGLVEHQHPADTVTLTGAGAAAQLALLAGWHTAADTADAYVTDLAAASAAELGLAAGWDRALVDERIRPLLELALAR